MLFKKAYKDMVTSFYGLGDIPDKSKTTHNYVSTKVFAVMFSKNAVFIFFS